MKVVKVQDIVIGEGKPKICVSIVGKNKAEVQEELALVSKKYVDIVEWRLDFFEYDNQLDHVFNMLMFIRNSIDNIPIILTLRTLSQGGNKDIDEEHYVTVLHHAMKSEYVDIVDIEYSVNHTRLQKLIRYAHNYKKKVILSYHDFKQTPSYEELIDRWKAMQSIGADILKVSVMPKNYLDVSNLMKASFLMYNQYAKQPMIAIAMSQLGSVSRVCAHQIGSSITFGTLHTPSAPGQLHVQEMKYLLDMLYDINLSNR